MAESGIICEEGEESEVIIAGVMDGVRQSFIDSGVDLEVLAKLEELWVSKLKSSGSPGVAIADVLVPAPLPRRTKCEKSKETEETEDVGSKTNRTCDSDIENIETELQNVPLISSPSVSKVKKRKHRRPKILQVDGPADSSDEEDAVDDDDDGDDDDDDDDDDDIDPDGDDDEGVEEEPLGSEDDISDEDASDLFETDNVVVCQYDKITRARNKWKFHLKDGIMNLNGKDYVFQRAHGDAEW